MAEKRSDFVKISENSTEKYLFGENNTSQEAYFMHKTTMNEQKLSPFRPVFSQFCTQNKGDNLRYIHK